MLSDNLIRFTVSQFLFITSTIACNWIAQFQISFSSYYAHRNTFRNPKTVASWEKCITNIEQFIIIWSPHLRSILCNFVILLLNFEMYQTRGQTIRS